MLSYEYLRVLELVSGVHGQATGATAEAVALRSELAPVAVFAEKFAFVF